MDKIKISLIVLAVIALTVIVGVSVGTDSLTGGTIIKSVTCYQDIDCDDHQEGTVDMCKNSGKTNSLCVNRQIE